MSCAYHEREFITIIGTVGKNTEVYDPQLNKKIFGVPILWEERWNIRVSSIDMGTSKLNLKQLINSPEFDGDSLKTYRFHEKADPEKKTEVINDVDPNSGDQVRLVICPSSNRQDTRRFCVIQVEVI